jgi:hypothetical protein
MHRLWRIARLDSPGLEVAVVAHVQQQNVIRPAYALVKLVDRDLFNLSLSFGHGGRVYPTHFPLPGLYTTE